MKLNHASAYAVPVENQRHRILSNVPAADVRPPVGVPVYFLDSVHFSMDIFETVQRGRATAVKRPRNLAHSNSMSKLEDQTASGLQGDISDELFLEVEGMVSSKRKRSPPLSSATTVCLPVIRPSEAFEEHRLPTRIFDSERPISGAMTSSDSTDLHTLVDGALKLSVVGIINSKSVPGIKVKANTFGPGLSQVAPALWRPEYLLVRRKHAEHVTAMLTVQ